MLTPWSQSNKTLLNDQPISEPAVLKVGDRIRLGYTGPIVEILSGGRRPLSLAALRGRQPPRSAKATSPTEEGYGATV
jgi:hypothetical protein